MTINVNPDRSTLSLPGARLRSEEPTLRAGPNGLSSKSQQQHAASAISVSPSAVADAGALRFVTSGLDRASSITDAALAASTIVLDLLTQLREAAAAERGSEFKSLVGRIGEAVEDAGFDGVNLLDGSTPGGALRVAPDGDSEITISAPDLRPGGPLIAVSAESDPAASLTAADASLKNAEIARGGLREDSKRVEAHRSFVGLLSDAIREGTPSLDVEGARLAALSIKQALSGTTVSLGAGGPKTILSLFR